MFFSMQNFEKRVKIMALKSKFEKRNNGALKATKIFTDRVNAREVFKNSINSIHLNNKEIVVFYGIGGVGKTKLLNELLTLSDELYSSSNFDVSNSFVSLDAYDYSNYSNILLTIRSQLNYNCDLFDYAYLKYCEKAQYSVNDIKNKFEKIDSPVVEVINEALSLGFGSVTIPTKLISKSLSFIKDIYFKNKYKDIISEISDLNEFELLERLPYYLGLVISNAAEVGKNTTIFIDSYESSLYSNISFNDPEEWLKELFLSSKKIRIVIASRDKIKWYKEDEEWEQYLNQHLLDRLSDEDCCYYLKSVPIQNENIIDSITKSSQGLPLYLDISVDIYENKINNGEEVHENDFVFDGPKLIKRYVKYLSKEEKIMLSQLVYFDYFSVEFALSYLKKCGIFIYKNDLLTFFDKSIFIKDEENDTFRIDNTVRQVLAMGENDDDKLNLLSNIIDMYGSTSSDYDYTVYYLQALNSLNELSECKNKYFDKILDIMINLISLGKWNEIASYMARFEQSDNPYIKILLYFSKLLLIKRTNNLKVAYEVTQNHPEFTSLYQDYLNRFIIAKIIHLLGDYDLAIKEYEKLINDISFNESVLPHTLYVDVSIKYADLLFLKGLFRSSLEIFDRLAKDNNISIASKIEVLRTKGHIYRFNLMGDIADKQYRIALDLAIEENNIAQIGKLYTNLSENFCLCSAHNAVHYAQESEKINTMLSNYIEVGKAYSAVSIAKRVLNEPDYSIYAEKAFDICDRDTGYKSGKVFALASKLMCEDNLENQKRLYKKMEEIINETNVYNFLLEIMNCFIYGDSQILLNSKYQWINIEETVESIKNQSCLRRGFNE